MVLPSCRRAVGILIRAAGMELLKKRAQKRLRELNPALFLKMFRDLVENATGWTTERLGSLIENGPQIGLDKLKLAYRSGTPILRIDGFYGGIASSPAGWQRLCLDDSRLNKCKHVEDDIVINRVYSRRFLGKSAIIPKIHEPAVFKSSVMRLRVDANRMLPRFFVSMLQLETIRSSLCRNAKDAIIQSTIIQADVHGFMVVVPPRHLQHQFARTLNVVRSILAVAQFRDRTTLELSAALVAPMLDGDA